MPKKRKKRKRSQGEDEFGTKEVNEQLDEVFDEHWDGVEAKSFEEVPDGTYQVRFISALVNNAKTSGRLQCSWEMIIVNGEHKGRHIFKHDGLNTEEGIAYFKGSLARLGYDEPETKKKLIATLEEIVEGPTYAVVRLSTRKRKVDEEYTYIQSKRFIKALDSDEVEDELEEGDLVPYSGGEPSEEGEGPSEGGEEDVWDVGDRVKVSLDDKYYDGKIKEISDDAETATITFDDGDEMEIAVDDLEEPEKEESKPEGEEPSCDLKKKKMTPTERRATNKFAKEDDFDPDNYDNSAQLLCEIGDYYGLSGTFKDPAALLQAIKKAKEE